MCDDCRSSSAAVSDITEPKRKCNALLESVCLQQKQRPKQTQGTHPFHVCFAWATTPKACLAWVRLHCKPGGHRVKQQLMTPGTW